MTQLGSMAMPSSFKYKNTLKKGFPSHTGWDPFLLRHPSMGASKWAKIFAPFDALKGFNDAIQAKEAQYVDQAELDEDTERELNRKLSILKSYTFNSRMARVNKIIVTVTCFVPCTDQDSHAFDLHQGQYKRMTGMVLQVDEINNKLSLQSKAGTTSICFSHIRSLASLKMNLFDDVPDWEKD